MRCDTKPGSRPQVGADRGEGAARDPLLSHSDRTPRHIYVLIFI